MRDWVVLHAYDSAVQCLLACVHDLVLCVACVPLCVHICTTGATRGGNRVPERYWIVHLIVLSVLYS